jgi:hypothetical protein
MAFSLCGLSYLLVVAAVIAVVFVGDAAAATKVWFNKIISPPSLPPAAPPPSFSALCCWWSFASAQDLAAEEFDLLASLVLRILPWADLVQGELSRRLMLFIVISTTFASAPTPQQSGALEFLPSTSWLYPWCGILVQDDSLIFVDKSYHIYRSSVCFFYNGFTSPLSTDALCAVSARL